MIDIFQGDPYILMTDNGATLFFSGGQPVMDQGVENQALIALLTEEGWPGNHLLGSEANQIGSSFEKLARGPITLSRLSLIEKTAEAALQADIFGTVRAVATNPESWRIDLTITIEPPGGDLATILLTTNGQNWVNQAENPAHLRLNKSLSPFFWDETNSAAEVLRNSSADIFVTGGQGPFLWGISGTGFALDEATTSGTGNKINADGAATGTATITVTDSAGQVATGYVIEPNNGSWVLWKTQKNAEGYISGIYDSADIILNHATFYKTVGHLKLEEKVDVTGTVNQPSCSSGALPSGNDVELEIAGDCDTVNPAFDAGSEFWCCKRGALHDYFSIQKKLYRWQ